MADNVQVDNGRLDNYTMETEQQSGGQQRQVVKMAGTLVPENYDYFALTYVAAGNGAGEIETIVYKTGGAAGTTVATITNTYNADNKLSTVTKT